MNKKLGRKPFTKLERARVHAARKWIDYHANLAAYFIYTELFKDVETEKKLGRKKQDIQKKVDRAKQIYLNFIEAERKISEREDNPPPFDITIFVDRVLSEKDMGKPKASLIQKIEEQKRKVEYQLRQDDVSERTHRTGRARIEMFNDITKTLTQMLSPLGVRQREIEIAYLKKFNARKRVRDGDASDEALWKRDDATRHFELLQAAIRDDVERDPSLSEYDYFIDMGKAFDYVNNISDPMVKTAYRDFIYKYKLQQVMKNKDLFVNLAEQAKKNLGIVSLQKDKDDIGLL
ncbi:hypothetical protein [Neptuniibacter sp.]|uniref:hypothetical protein n=1 Tax=Neptuniibacter sp. TaxID=1962643 RepID=UPI003B5C0C0D